jgi:hypothetical protein
MININFFFYYLLVDIWKLFDTVKKEQIFDVNLSRINYSANASAECFFLTN